MSLDQRRHRGCHAAGELAAKWRAFGWDVLEIDGNDTAALTETFRSLKPGGKPHLVLAHTVKGKGISFMENRAEWHHGVLNAEQYAKAMEELSADAEGKN